MELTPTFDPLAEERSRLLTDLRSNYNLALMSLLPGVEHRSSRLKPAARRLGLTEEQFESYRERFLRNRLWIEENGITHANFELLDLGDLKISDYMAMTVNILAKLASEQAQFETLSLATNRDLVRKFVAKVNQALKSLYNESQTAEKTTIFSWTHAGVIDFEVKIRKTESPEEFYDS